MADKLDPMDNQLGELLDQVAADAEAVQGLPDDGASLPAHCTVSRPNRPASPSP